MNGSYRDCSLVRFAELVAAREPGPGGGPVAAITVSLAAALVAMAARYSTQGDLGEEQAQMAERLSSRAADLADADTVAYEAVIEAYAATGDGDSAHRAEQIRETMHRAAEVALEVAQLGAETGTLAAQLAAQLAVEGKRSVRGEAVTAVLLAEAATRSAAHLVAVDVDAGGDDELVRRAQRSVETAHAASLSVPTGPALSAG